jgi:hypothetical protein
MTEATLEQFGLTPSQDTSREYRAEPGIRPDGDTLCLADYGQAPRADRLRLAFASWKLDLPPVITALEPMS